MSPQDYPRALAEAYAEHRLSANDPSSRLEYLADNIFNFTTYDTEQAELFATKAIEVCEAITNRTTYEYIRKSGADHTWFLLMCNMPFFDRRLNWGTSIRGAWWDTSTPNASEFDTTGLVLDGEQVTTIKCSTEDWAEFIAAVIAFGRLK
jgi:hypothetical protein